MGTISNDDFHMSHIGRGKWNDWHSVGFAIETRDQVLHEYEHVAISCDRIRCQECYDHAKHYIATTYDYVMSFLINYKITDSEVIDFYNRWLYDFHCAANINAGKNPETFPSYQKVIEYYTSTDMCTEKCGH